jgi:hypothetical protein
LRAVVPCSNNVLTALDAAVLLWWWALVPGSGQAALAEGRIIPWAMDPSSSTMATLHALMMQCLASDRSARPTIAAVIDRLRELREASRRAGTQFGLAPSS